MHISILEKIYSNLGNIKSRRNFRSAFCKLYTFEPTKIDKVKTFLEENLNLEKYTNWSLELPFKETFAILVDGFSITENRYFKASQLCMYYGDRYLYLSF
jgi:hypothetical protein